MKTKISMIIFWAVFAAVTGNVNQQTIDAVFKFKKYEIRQLRWDLNDVMSHIRNTKEKRKVLQYKKLAIAIKRRIDALNDGAIPQMEVRWYDATNVRSLKEYFFVYGPLWVRPRKDQHLELVKELGENKRMFVAYSGSKKLVTSRVGVPFIIIGPPSVKPKKGKSLEFSGFFIRLPNEEMVTNTGTKIAVSVFTPFDMEKIKPYLKVDMVESKKVK